jgi:3-oxoacyl-[acyl-carrier protein] reductase
MDLGLHGHTALVTGGSGAIGRAVAVTLAAEGADVAVTWNTGRDRADQVVEEIVGRGGRAHAVRIDQSDRDSIASGVAEVRRELGVVAIVVANAVRWPAFEVREVDGLEASLAANLTGTVALIDAVLPDLRTAGWGRIVAVSTDIVEQPMSGPVAYAAAKGGLETAARVLAVREARHGILTNVVRPGLTLTERALSSSFIGQEGIDAEAAQTPTGRVCTPQDVANAVAFLASEVNGHINGQVLSVAGGRELTR